MLIGGILQILPLFLIIVISIVLNKDLVAMANNSNQVDVASWAYISLIPGSIGGYAGEKYGTVVTEWIKNKSLAVLGKGENQMRKTIGGIFKILGYIVFAITGIWGFFLCMAIISHVAGFWGIVVGLTIAPLTFVAAPLYAGFTWGNWFPLVLNYGGGLAAAIIVGIGSALSGD